MEKETIIRLSFFLGIFLLMALWEVMAPKRKRTTSQGSPLDLEPGAYSTQSPGGAPSVSGSGPGGGGEGPGIRMGPSESL